MALRNESTIGVDADSGLVHTVIGTAANVNDVTQASALVHGEESDVVADAGYQGVAKREETQGIEVNWRGQGLVPMQGALGLERAKASSERHARLPRP